MIPNMPAIADGDLCKPDPITGNDPDFDKRTCKFIAEFFQRRITERLIEKAHRFGIGPTRGAFGQ